MKTTQSLLLLLFGLLAWPVRAQVRLGQASAGLRLMATYTGDSIVLRWKPTNALAWKSGNLSGYRLIRYTIDEQTQQTTDSLNLTPRPLKALTASEWQTRFAPSDTLAKGFARLLTETKPVPNSTLGDAYTRKNANDYRFAFAMLFTSIHPTYAQAMALGLTDKRIERNKTYLYVLQAAPGSVSLGPIGTDRLIVRTSNAPDKPAMPFVRQVVGDRVVTFTWNRQLGNQQFVAYLYERSADKGKTFRRVSNEPFIGGNKDSLNITLIDSLPRNYVAYQYRITGITVFGINSQPTPNLTVMGHDLTPPQAVNNLKAVNTKGSEVELSWTKPEKEGDFAGFVVGKSRDVSGPFAPLHTGLLPKEATRFKDSAANPDGTNYYAVTVVDTAGNTRMGVPAYVVMRDETAPAKPAGLAGKIDSLGIVRFTWAKNKEPDLQGYMVYVANAPDHVFTPLTADFLTAEFFTDSISLRTLSEKIYYRVVAFDKSRRASPYSDMLELKKPDRIAPVSPVFDRFFTGDSSVTLHWIRSSSDDVTGQILYRMEESGSQTWRELARLDKTKASYVDKTVLPRHDYQYTLVAVDDSQNASERSYPQRVRTYDSGIRKGVQNLSVSAGRGQPIQLTWTGVSLNSRILVYRKINELPLQLIDNLPGSQQTFADKPTIKGVYQYALKTIYRDGTESLLTPFSKTTVN